MNQINSLIIEGTLVEDCFVDTGTGKMQIAVERSFRNREGEIVKDISKFDVECYGKMTEYCEKYAKKSREIRVVGRIKQETWKDSDGKSFSKVYIVAEHIEFKPIKQQEQKEVRF